MGVPVSAAAAWREMQESLRRPYRVRLPMVVLLGLVPGYIFIAAEVRGGTAHVLTTSLDRLVPLQPWWAIVYGALYLALILLPVFVVREEALLRRTVLAYLSIWITAYLCFLAYPTIAPRPVAVPGDGFGAWGLRGLYGMDPPYNCFPSLHVAHSFVSALAAFRVHRRVGQAALVAATLVALSTLFTKQHYVLDVVAGTALGAVAYVAFLRSHPRDTVPEHDRRVAPYFGVAVAAVAALGVGGAWLAYLVPRFLPG